MTVTASDSTGIRSLALIDVTGAPAVVGSEDYAIGTTDGGAKCDFSRPAPCPNLAREVIRPTSMPEGNRMVLVRVTDTGGNVADRGPFPVNAITPSNRGAFNGSGATDAGSLQIGFTRSKKSHRTVGYGQRIGIGGRLRNSGGGPVAGAQVIVLTRDLRKGAQTIARKTVTTRADGSFSYRAAASASRVGRRMTIRGRIRPGASSPYRTGYSNGITVRVR